MGNTQPNHSDPVNSIHQGLAVVRTNNDAAAEEQQQYSHQLQMFFGLANAPKTAAAAHHGGRARADGVGGRSSSPTLSLSSTSSISSGVDEYTAFGHDAPGGTQKFL